MHADTRRAKSPYVPAHMPWLVAIGQQLREDLPPGPVPNNLSAQLEKFEAGETEPEPAAVRLAIINAVVRASVARRSPSAVSSIDEEWCDAPAPDVVPPSRQAITLGRFEKLVLDLFDNHLSEPERGFAVRKFVAYLRVCHAMLDVGLIKQSELAFD